MALIDGDLDLVFVGDIILSVPNIRLRASSAAFLSLIFCLIVRHAVNFSSADRSCRLAVSNISSTPSLAAVSDMGSGDNGIGVSDGSGVIGR